MTDLLNTNLRYQNDIADILNTNLRYQKDIADILNTSCALSEGYDGPIEYKFALPEGYNGHIEYKVALSEGYSGHIDYKFAQPEEYSGYIRTITWLRCIVSYVAYSRSKRLIDRNIIKWCPNCSTIFTRDPSWHNAMHLFSVDNQDNVDWLPNSSLQFVFCISGHQI